MNPLAKQTSQDRMQGRHNGLQGLFGRLVIL